MWRTDDPVHDAAMHDIELEQELEDCPDCAICGEKIYPGDYYWEYQGEYFHEDCIKYREYEG